MKTLEEIKSLNEFEAIKCDQIVHVLWTEICAGSLRMIADEDQTVSSLMESMDRGASDTTREVVEKIRLKRTGIEWSELGDLPNSALPTLGDWLKAWSSGDDSITLSLVK